MEEIFSQIPILLHFPLETLLTMSCCSRQYHRLVQETIQQLDPIVWQQGIRRLWIRCHQISEDLHRYLQQQLTITSTEERLGYLSQTLK